MKKKWYAISLVFLLLTGCVPSETPVQEKVPDDRVSSLSAATPEESLGSATPQDVSTAWTEHVDIQRDHTASLRDGSPVPQQTLPLYYKGNWQGKTWAQLAEETGFPESDLRMLNPQVEEGVDGALSGNTPELLLSEAYAIPRTAEALVTVTVPSMPEAYRERSYQLPASLPDGAATVLALSYYNREAEGQGFTCEPSEVEGYRKVSAGDRFVTFSQAEEYFSAIYTEQALRTLMEPSPRQADSTAYYTQGEGETLLIQGYPFDSIIPQSGYTHTEPEEQTDGSLKFAGICVVVTDDEGKPLPEGAGRLYYTPSVLVETGEGWRVESGDPPF